MTLTPRQTEAMRFIEGHIRKHGYPPSIRDLGVGMHGSWQAARQMMDRLVRKGALMAEFGKCRTMRPPTYRFLPVLPNRHDDGWRVGNEGTRPEGAP